jgi:hypothetical protein
MVEILGFELHQKQKKSRSKKKGGKDVNEKNNNQL